MRTYDQWIDGAGYAPSGGGTIERRSPATGERLAAFAAGTPPDVEAAVVAARRAFDGNGWSGLPGSDRASILQQFAALIEADSERLAAIESEETGKPIAAARAEVAYATDLTRFAASLAWNIPGRISTHNGADKIGFVFHEPRGVVAMILPWNYPVVCLMQKLPFALAAGCAAVIKPSELTSGTALELVRLAAKAGVPAGVVNVVTGTGADVGEALAAHAGVDMISFTGSSRIGKQIARKAADTMKRVSLELGGKGANIVFADSDMDAAVEGALQGFIINQGEECCAGSRLLIERSIADEFLTRLVVRCKAVRLGAPDDEATEMGPLIHEAHLDRVLGYIDAGRREGARLLTGGVRLSGGVYDRGLFFPPTLFVEAKPEMTIWREEIFGPVASVMLFEGVEEAVSIANNTAYGLANGVWTRNLDKALAVTRRICSGMVYINCYLETIPQLPFGGMKESGVGRENGVEGLLEFMEVKAAFAKLRTSFDTPASAGDR